MSAGLSSSQPTAPHVQEAEAQRTGASHAGAQHTQSAEPSRTPGGRPSLRGTAPLGRIRPGLILAAVLLALVTAWALAPDLFTDRDPLSGDPLQRLQAPGTGALLGTDQLGRDVLSRIIHGAGSSLGTTAIAVLIAFGAGTAIGVVAGFLGCGVDAVLMRVIDVLQSIPGLLLSMSVVVALGFGAVNIALAVALASIPAFARVARGEVLRWRSTLFVEAARLNGIRTPEIVVRHVLPHAVGPVFALAALEFGSAILAVSALSFLGYGAPPPQPEWGLLVSEGRDFIASAWWLTTMPGLLIAAVVLSVNRIALALGSGRSRS
ncbi:ABC transporter permease [Brevibacterium album]|uniref:ABC transporter permease n=1 Tax=Brevibacterium album TaxID=417948 RepID=UPI00040A1B93|nr:ABC transporter permease [Brevibacterium album]